jgi:hypothetical protein
MRYPNIRTTADGIEVTADWTQDGEYTVWGPEDLYLGTIAPAESPLGTDWVPTGAGGTTSPGWSEIGNAMAVLWLSRDNEALAAEIWRNNVFGTCQEIFADVAWIEALETLRGQS